MFIQNVKKLLRDHDVVIADKYVMPLYSLIRDSGKCPETITSASIVKI